jgi:hypothetical protein
MDSRQLRRVERTERARGFGGCGWSEAVVVRPRDVRWRQFTASASSSASGIRLQRGWSGELRRRWRGEFASAAARHLRPPLLHPALLHPESLLLASC